MTNLCLLYSLFTLLHDSQCCASHLGYHVGEESPRIDRGRRSPPGSKGPSGHRLPHRRGAAGHTLYHGHTAWQAAASGANSEGSTGAFTCCGLGLRRCGAAVAAAVAAAAAAAGRRRQICITGPPAAQIYGSVTGAGPSRDERF